MPKGVFIRSAECNRINSESKKQSYANGRVSINKGKKFSEEHKLKISQSLTGNNNGFWKGGVSKKNIKTRVKFQHEIARWRLKVLFRDNFICKNPQCPYCKNVRDINSIAHHIKSFVKFPELRFDLENGLTCCKDYHKFIHSDKNISDNVYHATPKTD